MDISAFVSLACIVLADLATIFWVGAQLWHAFVLQAFESEAPAQQEIDRQVERRFERYFAIPIVLVLILANIAVLFTQGMTLADGDVVKALSLLSDLVDNKRTGVYWILREGIAIVALLLAIGVLWRPMRSRAVSELVMWVNLVLGLGLLVTLALSGPATTVEGTIQIYATLVDWLHWLASALWIGGLYYLVLVCLPILRALPPIERAEALLSIRARSTLLILVGIIILFVTGLFSSFVHIEVPELVWSSAYGRALLVKGVLVVSLLVCGVIQMVRVQPQLVEAIRLYRKEERKGEIEATAHVIAQRADGLETRLVGRYRQLTGIMRWEPVVGSAILVCAGLTSIFIGTLQPPTPSAPLTKPFNTTIQTVDRKFTLEVQVSPNRFGVNEFRVRVLDEGGKPTSTAQVTIFLNMVEMDMGTEVINGEFTGGEVYSGEGIFNMGGLWRLRIQVKTPDKSVHEAQVDVIVSY